MAPLWPSLPAKHLVVGIIVNYRTTRVEIVSIIKTSTIRLASQPNIIMRTVITIIKATAKATIHRLFVAVQTQSVLRTSVPGGIAITCIPIRRDPALETTEWMMNGRFVKIQGKE